MAIFYKKSQVYKKQLHISVLYEYLRTSMTSACQYYSTVTHLASKLGSSKQRCHSSTAVQCTQYV